MEAIIQSDPTLKLFVESEIDPKNFDWQIKLKVSALKLALAKYIDKKY